MRVFFFQWNSISFCHNLIMCICWHVRWSPAGMRRKRRRGIKDSWQRVISDAHIHQACWRLEDRRPSGGEEPPPASPQHSRTRDTRSTSSGGTVTQQQQQHPDVTPPPPPPPSHILFCTEKSNKSKKKRKEFFSLQLRAKRRKLGGVSLRSAGVGGREAGGDLLARWQRSSPLISPSTRRWCDPTAPALMLVEVKQVDAWYAADVIILTLVQRGAEGQKDRGTEWWRDGAMLAAASLGLVEIKQLFFFPLLLLFQKCLTAVSSKKLKNQHCARNILANSKHFFNAVYLHLKPQ